MKFLFKLLYKQSIVCLFFLFPFSFFLFSFFFFLFPVHAQSPQPNSRVIYPVTIPQVGTCASWAECRKLCDDPINISACYSWAIGAKIIQPKNETAIKQAIQELSSFCSSKESCALYCANPANKAQCLQVGQKYNLLPDYQKRAQNLVGMIVEGKVLDAVKEKYNTLKIEIENLAIENNIPNAELPDNLVRLCAKSENATRCKKIADALGEESATTPGPGGCRTNTSCRRYCDNPDNFSECNAFGMSGPQGCKSALSCYQVCQKGGCTNTTRLPLFTIDPTKTQEAAQIIQNISASCKEEINKTPKTTLLDTVGRLKHAQVCELFDAKNTLETNEKSCSEYLDENAALPFNAEEFAQYCTPLAIIPTKFTTAKNSSNQSELEYMNTICSFLEHLGNTQHTAYSIAASSCKSSYETIRSAREECLQDTTERKVIRNSQDIRRYCLYTVLNVETYEQACRQNAADCQTGGYDWYCEKNPNECTQLVEGQSIYSFSRRFTNGINAIAGVHAINSMDRTNTSNAPGFFHEIRSRSGVITARERAKFEWDIPDIPRTAQEAGNRWSNIPFITPPSPTPLPESPPLPGTNQQTLPYEPGFIPTERTPLQNQAMPESLTVTTQPRRNANPSIQGQKSAPVAPPPLSSPRVTPTASALPINSSQQNAPNTYISPSPAVQGAFDTKPWWESFLESFMLRVKS
jgi:hypothetical protein